MIPSMLMAMATSTHTRLLLARLPPILSTICVCFHSLSDPGLRGRGHARARHAVRRHHPDIPASLLLKPGMGSEPARVGSSVMMHEDACAGVWEWDRM